MTKVELMERLPHRDAMLLVGDVETVEDENGSTAVGTTEIRGDEWFLRGHFPDNPVVPGVILCEIMAQSVCALISTQGALPFFSGMKNVKWRKPVRPGDTFVTRSRITRRVGNFYFVSGIGYVNDEVVMEADFSFALTESGKEVNNNA